MDEKRKGMVNWFSFYVLWDAFKRVTLSTIFGQYADSRLLYNIPSVQNTGGSDELKISLNEKEEIWFDYVADIGDGYNSTYTIAYLLGKPHLEVDKEILPQGDFLIMGGDQVYPTPSRENYSFRTTNLYSDAYPDQGKKQRKPAFILPGNHDWYDGLRLFNSLFCDRGESDQLGNSNWKLPQKRSYFFIRLPHNWRMIGIDTQLECDIDKTQAHYFNEQIKSDANSDYKKVIIFVSEPSWLTADVDMRYERGLKYIVEKVIKPHWDDKFKIYVVIAGDLHHYNRYINSEGVSFITAGGGGAFLHPTHNLKEQVYFEWGKDPHSRLILQCAYPSKSESRVESKKIWWKFSLNNFSFGFILALIYSFFVLPIAMTSGQPITIVSLLVNPLTAISFALTILAFYKYDNYQENQKRIVVGALHGFLQFLNMVFGILILPKVLPISWIPWGWGTVSLIALFIFFTGLISGFIFGIYLCFCSYYRGRKDNDSFSSLRLSTYKNFLRIKLKKNEIIIYPIGIDASLAEKEWVPNDTDKNKAKVIPNTRVIIDETQIYHSIEKPIIIKANDS